MLYTVDLRVDPLVASWLEHRFPRNRGVYILGKSPWMMAVSAMLQQSHVGRSQTVPDRYDSFVPVKVSVSEYDFYHYGWEVSPMQEVRFSRLVRNFVTDECLRSAAMLRARYNVTLTAAINTYLLYYGIDEEHIRFETLRKIYRRHYRKVEDEYRALDRAAVTDFGTEPAAMQRKILNLHSPKNPDPNQPELPFMDD